MARHLGWLGVWGMFLLVAPSQAQETPDDEPPPPTTPAPPSPDRPIAAATETTTAEKRETRRAAIDPLETEPLVPPEDPDANRDLHRIHDGLKIATSVSFAVTGVLGLFNVLNQPTAFGEGSCGDDGEDIFKSSYGCDDGMSILHGVTGIATTVLYTSEGVMGAVIPPDPTDLQHPIRDVLSYVHIGGMIVTPIIGLLAARPELVNAEESDSWPKVGRTIHMFSGVVTAGAYWTTTAMEL